MLHTCAKPDHSDLSTKYMYRVANEITLYQTLCAFSYASGIHYHYITNCPWMRAETLQYTVVRELRANTTRAKLDHGDLCMYVYVGSIG